MNASSALGAGAVLMVLGLLMIAGVPVVRHLTPVPTYADRVGALRSADASANGSVLGNFTSALNRLVALMAAGGGAILALVWARVALSWFSNDVTKKVQAKDRARDALVGTVIFAAALSGIVWGLARWVLSGS